MAPLHNQIVPIRPPPRTRPSRSTFTEATSGGTRLSVGSVGWARQFSLGHSHVSAGVSGTLLVGTGDEKETKLTPDNQDVTMIEIFSMVEVLKQ